MQGIGPGTILGGRYTAEQRTTEDDGAELWTARDSILDRAVTLFAVSRRHANVAAVLDAARRVAGLDNGRLSRILDVGSDEEIAFVIEESLEGSHSLSSLLADGALPAPEVRRIAGEVSLVLDVARHRGLHHQRLTPAVVFRTTDGDVKVRGLATLAALAGVDDVSDQQAAREDAVAVVALTYAGFTGRWPLEGDGGGLPPAPRVASHVAAPSEIATGVPADLDALCRLTLAGGQGPTTPGDFARQIAPWSPIPILLPTVSQSSSEPSPETAFPAREDVLNQGEAAEVTRSRPIPDDDADADHTDDTGHDADHTDADSDKDITEPSTDHSRTAGAGDATRATPGGTRGVRPAAAAAGFGVAAAAGAAGTAGPKVPGGVPTAHRIPSPTGKTPAGKTSARMTPASAVAESADPDTPPPGAGPGEGPGGRGTATPVARAAAAAPSTEPTTSTEVSAGSAAPLGPSPVAEMGAKTAAAFTAAGAATAGAAKAMTGRLSDWSSQNRERRSAAAQERQARREAEAARRAEEDALIAQARTEQQAAEEESWAADEDYGTETGAAVSVGASSAALGTSARSARSGTATDRFADHSSDRESDRSFDSTYRSDDKAAETPVPLLPPSSAEPLTRDQSRMAIGIIIVFLVLALGFAMWGLSKIPLPGLPDMNDTAVVTPPPTSDPDATDEPETGTDAPPDAAATPGQPLEFVDVVDYDPLGDGEERPAELDRITDGDDSTFWGSEGYRNSTFSNLKTGVGVVLDLGEASSISEVNLVLPSASAGEIFVSEDEQYFTERPAPDELEAAGTFDGNGAVTVELADGTQGRYVIVWFTEISRQGDWFRARLAEASATS